MDIEFYPFSCLLTLFLWTTDGMNYSNIRLPLRTSYLTMFPLALPHLHVYYSTCNFSRIPTFQTLHVKT